MWNLVTVRMEMGRWTIRVNGNFVIDFHRWREAQARRLEMNLADALELTRREEAITARAAALGE